MKPIGFIVTSLLLLSSFLLPAHAGTPEELTLKKAFVMASAENPQLKAKQMELEMGEGDIRTAGLLDNPVLVSDSGIAEKTYRVGIKQTIPLGRRRKHQVDLAVAQLDVTQAQVDTAWLTLKREIRKTYMRLFLAQQKQQAFKEVYDNLQELAVVLKAKKAKECMQLELSQLQVENKIQMGNAEIFQARSKLNTLLNKPLTQQWKLSPPENLIKKEGWLDELVEEALTHRPEIQQKKYEVDVVKEEMALAKSKRIPDLALTVGPDWVTEKGQKEVGAFFITNLELPIFNRNQGQIQKHMAHLMQLEYEQAALQNQIRMQVVNAYVIFQEAQAQLIHYQQILKPKSKELVKLVQKDLESGYSSIEDALDAQSTDMDISQEHFKASQDYQDAISELEQSVGKSLDD
jgi:outer membrane protein, heavy metal efflux system